MNLMRGQRLRLGDVVEEGQPLTVGLTIILTGGQVADFACFGLDAAGRLSDDRYMTFFNQPRTPCGGVCLVDSPTDQTAFMVDLARLPETIGRLVFTAAIDGAATMNAMANGWLRLVDAGGERARLTLRGSDFTGERALMVAEVYRKDGAWRLSATAQGFDGGLAALVGHFGGTVAEEPPASPVPVSPPPVSPPAVSLVKKMADQPPHLVSLAKQAAVSLEKCALGAVVARVGLVLDASGSMRGQYKRGRVQEVIDRVLPLAVHFDDDGAFDVWTFASRTQVLSAVTLATAAGYVEREAGGWRQWMEDLKPAVNFEPAAIRAVIDHYGRRPSDGRPLPPTYVIFISDGGVANSREIESLIVEASRLPIFWQFVGLGGRNYGILERLDTMGGRVVDNCGFFALDDLHDIDAGALYDRLLGEFPAWLRAARAAGVL